MKKRIILAVFIAVAAQVRADRVTLSFDADWRFLKGDAPGAEQPAFDDAGWRTLDVPHDWSIVGPFSPTNKTGGAGAFLPSGVGWYRKAFTLPAALSNQCAFIEFDGVMANSDVWMNGHLLGHRPNGYVSLHYELTQYLRFGPGATNVLAVRTDTSAQPASRWYTGAGIYRPVRLVLTAPLHLEYDSVFVTTPAISSTQTTVRVAGVLTNELDSARELTVEVQLTGPHGGAGPRSRSKTIQVDAKQAVEFAEEVQVASPELWDLDSASLYLATVLVRAGAHPIDSVSVKFGIRDARFTADEGFVLNGRKVMIKGVCLHHDGGAFGAAVPSSIWEQRLEALRELGCNAIRTSHNPAAPEFLDLCDRMGFLVMDEFFDCWTVGKNPYDYHLDFNQWSHTDERDTIRRDRNHPSIIIYSVGNEIHDTPQAELAKRILTGLVEVAHAADPTRPVTMALFRPNVSHDYDNGLADLLDVVGQNYRVNEILAAHAQKPTRKILGTENTHDRGSWLALRDNPPYAGQFLWTGIDYLGESRRWPLVGFSSGLLDRTGRAKPVAFQRQSWWSDQPMVYVARRVARSDLMPTDPGYGGEERFTQVLFPDWTPRNSAPHEETVEVYSNCQEVELFLNGQSLGSQPLHADATPRLWKVPYEPGTLRAVGRDDGKIVASDGLHTAGKPAKIVLSTECTTLSPGFDHVAEVRAKITDANDIEIPRADDLISFAISGPGEIAAVDNGNNASHEPFQATERQAYRGECVAYVRATAGSGELRVSASAEDLGPGSIVIQATR